MRSCWKVLASITTLYYTYLFSSLHKRSFAFTTIVPNVTRDTKFEVLSIFLCKIFIGQFFEERQIFTHFTYRV